MDLSNIMILQTKLISKKLKDHMKIGLRIFQRTYTNEPVTHCQVVRFSYGSQHLT